MRTKVGDAPRSLYRRSTPAQQSLYTGISLSRRGLRYPGDHPQPLYRRSTNGQRLLNSCSTVALHRHSTLRATTQSHLPMRPQSLHKYSPTAKQFLYIVTPSFKTSAAPSLGAPGRQLAILGLRCLHSKPSPAPLISATCAPRPLYSRSTLNPQLLHGCSTITPHSLHCRSTFGPRMINVATK